VRVELENTADMAGSEVVQVYLSYPALGILTSERKLVGFSKVKLEAGESQTLSLNVPLEQLATIPGDILGTDPAEVMPGTYTFSVGKLSQKLDLP
jgi:beta-glucosidase